jgi:hypothetical protein
MRFYLYKLRARVNINYSVLSLCSCYILIILGLCRSLRERSRRGLRSSVLIHVQANPLDCIEVLTLVAEASEHGTQAIKVHEPSSPISEGAELPI